MMGKKSLRKFNAILCGAVILLFCSSSAFASYAKFDIPGDFPGDFRIDFLGTDLILNNGPGGTLSTASTIDFSVGSETSLGSGIYNISVAPDGFQFVGFSPYNLDFDVYGAGTGYGTFNTNTGDWSLNMPTLFVDVIPDSYGSSLIKGLATRIDLYLTTQNIFIPTDPSDPSVGYTTTSATPMIIDPNDPNWGDLNLVAGGPIPHAADLLLDYDWGLINAISTNYDTWEIDTDPFASFPLEFDIYGNDPQINAVPEPASLLLLGSGLVGIVALKRKMH